MHALSALLESSEEFQTILAGLASHGDRLCIEGASGAGKSLLIAGVVRRSAHPALVIAHNEEHAGRLFDDLTALLADDDLTPVLRYPSITETLYDGLPGDRTTLGGRLAALERLAQGRKAIVVAAVSAVMHLTVPPERVRQGLRELAVGATVDRDALARDLVALGYERADLINGVGQFSVRGDIVDLFPAGAQDPVRVELFGDVIDSLRSFDPGSQRSTSSLTAVAFGPAAELIPDPQALDDGMTRIENALAVELRKLRERERYDEAKRLDEGVRR
ncbi:MAG: hypothetical protein FJX74_12835, partial [Armatimonadetes bacterium]|nr:hypothetical protein [Armatimonadota bacterium]